LVGVVGWVGGEKKTHAEGGGGGGGMSEREKMLLVFSCYRNRLNFGSYADFTSPERSKVVYIINILLHKITSTL